MNDVSGKVLVMALVSIPFGVCIILGADRGDFGLITAGATPLAAALGAVVTFYFKDKETQALKAENKSLKAMKEK